MPMTDAVETFRQYLQHPEFPCVGAKSALATDSLVVVQAEDLRSDASDAEILAALRRLPVQSARLVSVTVLFPATPPLDEVGFEAAMWERLQSLHDKDRIDFEWDPRVSSDPASPDFGMSLGGAGYFVVGMHPGASRLARRAPMATLAFNPHAQFRRLKAGGRYARLRDVVRDRDVAIQGAPNPMLADHGIASEAAQYSGRAVDESWRCPFRNRSRHA